MSLRLSTRRSTKGTDAAAIRKWGMIFLTIGIIGQSIIHNRLLDLNTLSGNELLAAMDVFVFPSIFEGFGNAVIEAQAAGLRCVISDRIPQEVVRKEDCIRLPLEAPEQWAEMAISTQRSNTIPLPLEDYDMNNEIRRLEKLYLD